MEGHLLRTGHRDKAFDGFLRRDPGTFFSAICIAVAVIFWI